jgi:hypothetical protein
MTPSDSHESKASAGTAECHHHRVVPLCRWRAFVSLSVYKIIFRQKSEIENCSAPIVLVWRWSILWNNALRWPVCTIGLVWDERLFYWWIWLFLIYLTGRVLFYNVHAKPRNQSTLFVSYICRSHHCLASVVWLSISTCLSTWCWGLVTGMMQIVSPIFNTVNAHNLEKLPAFCAQGISTSL